MQFFLVRLAYTAESWRQQLAHAPAIEQRLAAVKRLIGDLGGSLPHYSFFPERTEAGKGDPVVVHDKFIGLDSDELVTILAMPDERAALAFRSVVAAEPGIKHVTLSPLVPMRDALDVLRMAGTTRDKVGYAAPGGANGAWHGMTTGQGRARRKRAAGE